MEKDRRNFIKASAAGSAALLLSTLESFSIPLKSEPAFNRGYDLKIMATSWGFQGTIDAFCAKARKEGYDGIELWWPANNKKTQDEIFNALKTHGLDIGFLFIKE